MATGIPAIVLSYGADVSFNADGSIRTPISAAEQENTNGNSVFVLQTFSSDPNQPFDDMLVWLSPNVLMNRMVMAGRLP